MKQRVFAFFLAFVMLFNSVPPQAFATEVGDVPSDEGALITTFCENELCLLREAETHDLCVYCEEEGCLLKAEPHEEHKFAEADPETYCEEEGCLLKAEPHEEHKFAEADPETYCEEEGCLLKAEPHEEHKFAEADPEIYCEEEGCLLKAEPHEEHKFAEADPETYCEEEGCLLKAEPHEEHKFEEEAQVPVYNLGWEYAAIEYTLEGSSAADVLEGSLSDKVTVSIDGEPMTEGELAMNLLTQDSEAVLTLETAEGYALGNVAIALSPDGAFDETVAGVYDAYGFMTDESTETDAAMNLADIYAYMMEGDPANVYLLVELVEKPAEDAQEEGTAAEDAAEEDSGFGDTYAYNRNTGYPTDLSDDLYVAIYNGDGFPGEPAWYNWTDYTNFNSSYSKGTWTKFSSNASDILDEKILENLTQGVGSNTTKVWGYFNAAGTKDMFKAGSSILKPENEAKIIKAIKGNNVNPNEYEVIWYVIKFQTDTYWHIDGIVVKRQVNNVRYFNVNYYGNGNTSGAAPTGAKELAENSQYTILGQNSMTRTEGNQTWQFMGWNTKADGSGTSYKPGEKITIESDVSLYAQWEAPKTSIRVSKLWADNDNELGLRTDSVTVHLLRNGVDVATATLSAANSWTYTFADQPAVDNDGKLITYTVAEESVFGYTTSYTGSQQDGYTVINTVAEGLKRITTDPGKVVITGQKVWQDKGNANNSRPSSVTILLKANGVEIARTTASAPDWVYSFDISDGVQNMDMQNVTFTIDELEVQGYSKGTVVNPTVSFKVMSATDWEEINPCNELHWENTSAGSAILAAKKGNRGLVWTPDPLAPFERDIVRDIIDDLGINGNNTTFISGEGVDNDFNINVTSESIIFQNSKDWSWYRLGIYNRSTSSATLSSITNIRNDYQITVSKEWNDGDNQDNKRPASVKVHLLKNNGEHAGQAAAVLSEDNNWTHTWKDLPMYDATGKLISYSVSEEPVDGYTVSYTGTAASGFVITNTYEPETTVLNVRKAWNDANNQDNIRPTSVSVQLYADGEPYGVPYILQQSESFNGQWTNLPKYKKGVLINYTVQEVGTVDGYTVTESKYLPEENLWRITNSHVTDKTSVSVEKQWEDADNQDGLRPVELYVTLFQNGVATDKTLTLTEANQWEGSFTNLELNHGIGVPNVYTVHETGYKMADGKTVKNDHETVPAGYTATHGGSQAAGFVLTNKHEPEVTSVKVQKAWDDQFNQDGIRPEAVQVTLYKGETELETVALSNSNGWTHTFDNLPKYADGALISYTVKETGYKRTAADTSFAGMTDNQIPSPDAAMYLTGYEAVVSGSQETGFVITNTHNPEQTSLTVKKNWSDENNINQMRPYAIEITLLKNGSETVETVILKEDNSWQHTWDELDRFHDGQRISYSLLETGYYKTEQDLENEVKQENLPSGYNVTHSYTNTLGSPVVNITNTYEPEKTALNVQKEWKDGDNRDGLRPASVQVKLQWKFDEEADTTWEDVLPMENASADGLKIDGDVIMTLSPENEWDVDFVDLPLHFQHKTVRYRAAEVDVSEHYTVSYSLDRELNAVLITNTYDPETTSVSVSKVWNDDNNRDGIRDSSVTVTLLRNGVALTSYVDDAGTPHAGEVQLSAANGWEHTFTNLPKNHLGKPITYTVTEAPVEGYKAEITGSAANGFVITNTHEVKTMDIPVYKHWVDENDNDGVRLKSVKVTLMADGEAVENGTVTLSAENEFTTVFKGMPVYRAKTAENIAEAAEKIVYTLVETPVTGYYMVANSQDVAPIEDWTLTLGENNEFQIYNKHDLETVDVSVTKTWDDGGNADTRRPAEIVFHLLKDGAHAGETFKVSTNSSKDWKAQWTGLKKYTDGYEHTYTVIEETVEGYVTTYKEVQQGDEISVAVTNKYNPAKRAIIVEKVWDDRENQDNVRPTSIQVKLFKTNLDGSKEQVGETVTLSAGNYWRTQFKDLPVNHPQTNTTTSGTPTAIVYSVEEVMDANASAEYTLSTSSGFDQFDKDTWKLINTHTTRKTSVSVQKQWEDADNQDGLRPVELYVTLFQNGVATDKTLTLTEANQWKGSFTDLELNHGIGVPNVYTVHETGYKMADGKTVENHHETVPAGYTATHGGSQADGFVLTNTHKPEVTSVKVQKAWDDQFDQDGIRPDVVEVTLYKGETVLGTAPLSNRNGWTHTFDNLPKYAEGKPIAYTVKETGYKRSADDTSFTPMTDNGIPSPDPNLYGSGYSATVDGNMTNGFTIINEHNPVKVNLKVTKAWEDNSNKDQMRPVSVEVTLLINGVQTEQKRVLNAANNWTAFWEDLYRFHDGQRISYSVQETGYSQDGTAITAGLPTGYSVTHSYDHSDVFNPVVTLTNIYNPAKTALNVQKEWADADNRDGKRPANISVKLQWRLEGQTDEQWVNAVPGEGVIPANYAVTQTLSPENEWDVDFTGLPIRYQYQNVEYRAVEQTIPEGYTPTYQFNKSLNSMVITNTYAAELTQLTVSKTWNDANNQDGKRADEVTVTLLRNGVALTSYVDDAGTTHDGEVPLNAGNNWSHTFENLPKNHEGKAITYSVKEDAVEGYTYTVTPAVNRITSAGSGLYVDLINTHEVETVNVSFRKDWDDANDQDGVRPDSITVYLMANGEKYTNSNNEEVKAVLDANTGYYHVFENLPKNHEGEAITYSVMEADVAGYEEPKIEKATDESGNEIPNSWVITNTHTPETVNVTAKKIWVDDNNRDGVRPASVRVELFADGVNQNKQKVLTAESGWADLKWTDLPKYAEGKLIRYTVYEVVEDLQIKSGTAATAEGGNTEAADSRAASRYVASYRRLSDDVTSEDFYNLEITNTYAPETTELSVSKVWMDDNNRDGLRPDSVVVRLYANGDDTGKFVTLSEENKWTAVFKNLYKKYEQGKTITYELVEDAVPYYNSDKYNANGVTYPIIKPDDHVPDHFVITNRYDPETTEVTVIKRWNDENDNDGVRPDSIQVQLLADGAYVEGAVAELSADNNWTYTFGKDDGKPLYVNHNAGGYVSEIKYTVQEVGFANGYTPNYSVEDYTIVITNTRAVQKTSVSVQKVWDDNNNNDGMRPESVTVTLLENGVPYVNSSENAAPATITLSAENDWKYTWENLYVYRAGQKVTYTVAEKPVEGYEASITGTAANGYVITNIHTPATWKTEITKVWKDYSTALRPGSVTVQLYKNGVAYGESLKITAEDKWVRSVELPVYEAGKKIEWTVKETKVPLSYKASYNQETLTITNTVIIYGSEESPFTGDDFRLGLWTTVLGTSGAGILALLLGKKKKNAKNK